MESLHFKEALPITYPAKEGFTLQSVSELFLIRDILPQGSILLGQGMAFSFALGGY